MTMLLKQLIVFVILGISVRRGDCCSIQDLITDETIVPGSTITKYVGENFDGLVAQYRVTDGSAQGGENSYCECGAECTSKVPFTVNQDGDIHEVIYRRPVNEENFFDKNPIFGPVFTLVMVCPGPVITPVLFVLQDANNNSPRFNLDGSSVSIEVPRHLKKGSSLVQYLSNPVWAYDEDVNETTNGRIDFKTDSSDFTVETLVSNAHGKPIFVPDIRLEKDAALYEPVQQSFVLTAEDQGEGFNTAVLTFSVTFAATENLYPPLFVNPVYEFVIPEQQFTGEVAKIEAFDGDGTQAITYEIQYNLGLDISVDEQGSVKLNTVVPTDFLERKALVILITAREVPTGSLDPKSSDVPLVLILPDPTDVTTTMSPSNTIHPTTCPECPYTCPEVTCPTNSGTTGSGMTSTTSANTAYPTTCPECPSTCPEVTCPPATCITDALTTASGITATTLGNSCPPCVCTTEAPTTPGPSLTFERQQYNAEVVENVQGYNILTVKAEHSGEMTVSYALDIGQDNAAFGRFIISELGVISTTQPLPIEPKYYVFNATAFAGGLADNALIQIQVISGVNCGQPLFQEVFFIADLNEEERKSNFMQVYVANPSNVLYYISDVEPEDYYGAFEIHNTTGFISCIEEVNREDYSEVILTIEAREKIQMVKKAEFSLATALVRIQDVNDNKPLFVDSPRVVAYPSGATFDESVSSPLAKFYAEDLDIGQNAEIVYSVDSTYFFMEEATGVLFATKTSLNCGIEECNINIYATDKGKPPLQSDPLSVSIKILSDEYIFVITVVGKNGTPLSPSNVTSELSSKIGYEVLLISAQPEISAKSFAEKTFSSEELSVSLFAMKEEDPVRREDFIRDYNAIEPSITLFERKGVIRQPDHGNQGQAGSDDLLAATIALSIVLGLVIAGGVAGFLYMRSKNELRRSSSTDHLRLQSEGESSTHSGETTIAIMPRVDEKKFGDSQIFQSEPKKIPNFTPDFIEFTNPSFEDDDIQKSTETSPDTPAIEVTDLDNSAPQTPRPVKSAIKNSMLDDDEGKEKKGGVRFDAEPEVFETDLESSKIQNDFL
ncbi:protocadherin Fat 2-like isoform X14 [Artemia franciscana]|uniref:protocadherin Fat 2-like isoform X14 n=1 Tax=Artemia franciscana TaxID=6661 RepID=UPI0032DAAFF7